MNKLTCRSVMLCLVASSFVMAPSVGAFGQAGAAQKQSDGAATTNAAEVLTKLDKLVEQNNQLQRQNQELMQEMKTLRQALANDPKLAATRPGPPQEPKAEVKENSEAVTSGRDVESSAQSSSPRAEANSATPVGSLTVTSNETVLSAPAGPVGIQTPPAGRQPPGDLTVRGPASTTQTATNQEEQKTWGTYTPNFGFKLANTEYGDANLSIFTYVRYLNQRLLAPTYPNAFGNVSTIQQRQDVELNKMQIKFLGWLLSPKFRYFLYAWTNNAAMGRSFYIALAGYTGFRFNRHFELWGGLNGLPGTRSIEGNFPFWLSVDSRHIADEFFRPSYSQGFWAKGEIVKRLRYHVMVGNNLSTLGVNAAQFNNKFNTVASALVWEPTTGEFGPGFGDYENHQKLATRLGLHFTRSDESKESQPATDAFENTQIRLSDGTIIFTPDIFGPGVEVTNVRYRMSTVDGGIKYKGKSLEGEYFMRWLDNYQGPGTAVIPAFFDHGFQLQASAMVVPNMWQVYGGGSKIFGEFGNPYDVRIGANWFPFKNRVTRWNNEALYTYKSPVGYTAVPFALGGKGWVFHSNFEVAF